MITAPIKWKDLSIAGAAQLVVQAVPGRRIRVPVITFTLTDAATVSWFSDSTPLITGMSFAATGGMAFYGADYFWFLETERGQSLRLTVSAGTLVGSMNYIEV